MDMCNRLEILNLDTYIYIYISNLNKNTNFIKKDPFTLKYSEGVLNQLVEHHSKCTIYKRGSSHRGTFKPLHKYSGP